MSCFFCSSDVGRPIDFCLWSYIIFSTMPRVSPSRSDSCSAGKTHEWRGVRMMKQQHLQQTCMELCFYLWVLRTDFLGVNFWICGNNPVPPLHLINLKTKNAIWPKHIKTNVNGWNVSAVMQTFLTFSKWTVTTFPSSMSQELSSTFTSLKSWPSITGGCPFRPTLMERRWMSTTTSLPLMRNFTSKGTASCGEM